MKRVKHGCCRCLILQNVMLGKQDYKFDTKLDGILTCNACFVVDIAYSKKRVEQLKKSIVAFGRVTTIHGDSCVF
jgi:hypothetical protein